MLHAIFSLFSILMPTLPQYVQQPTLELDSQVQECFTPFALPCLRGYRGFCHTRELSRTLCQYEVSAHLI